MSKSADGLGKPVEPGSPLAAMAGALGQGQPQG
jgi:hypothetical protein